MPNTFNSNTFSSTYRDDYNDSNHHHGKHTHQYHHHINHKIHLIRDQHAHNKTGQENIRLYTPISYPGPASADLLCERNNFWTPGPIYFKFATHIHILSLFSWLTFGPSSSSVSFFMGGKVVYRQLIEQTCRDIPSGIFPHGNSI